MLETIMMARKSQKKKLMRPSRPKGSNTSVANIKIRTRHQSRRNILVNQFIGLGRFIE
jgi:hypothetical protein